MQQSELQLGMCHHHQEPHRRRGGKFLGEIPALLTLAGVLQLDAMETEFNPPYPEEKSGTRINTQVQNCGNFILLGIRGPALGLEGHRMNQERK